MKNIIISLGLVTITALGFSGSLAAVDADPCGELENHISYWANQPASKIVTGVYVDLDPAKGAVLESTCLLKDPCRLVDIITTFDSNHPKNAIADVLKLGSYKISCNIARKLPNH